MTRQYAFAFASVSSLSYLEVFDITTTPPTYVGQFTIASPWNATPSAVCVDPDGRYLVLGSTTSPYIEVLDIYNGFASLTGSGGLFETLKNNAIAANDLSWSSQGVLAVLRQSPSPFLSLYDMSSGGSPLTSPSDNITTSPRAIKFSGDGNYLFCTGTFQTVGGDAEFSWWDTATWTLQTNPAATVNNANLAQKSLAVNYDGTFIASGTQKTGETLVAWTRSGSVLTKQTISSLPTTNNVQAIPIINKAGTRLYLLGQGSSGQTLFEYTVPGLVLQSAWSSQPFTYNGLAATPDF
jgi:WD40 repeat protein